MTMQTWTHVLGQEKKHPYFQSIMGFLQRERASGKIIYPSQSCIFNALKYTPYASVKVVILGQDPYHGPKQAHGLAFSVLRGTPAPPSLVNIFKELQAEFNIPIPTSADLRPWAEQGVLLLNTILTVETGKPQSHANIGWQRFTDAVIRSFNQHPSGIVFLLWGRYAQTKSALITHPRHHILKAAHPSPLSAHRGFMGCRHFIQANELLTRIGRTPIDWSLAS